MPFARRDFNSPYNIRASDSFEFAFANLHLAPKNLSSPFSIAARSLQTRTTSKARAFLAARFLRLKMELQIEFAILSLETKKLSASILAALPAVGLVRAIVAQLFFPLKCAASRGSACVRSAQQ